jgi:aldose sugar dehydrogenase
MKNTFSIIFFGLVMAMSCSENRKEQTSSKADTSAIRSEKHKFRVDTVAKGLKNPWGMAFLPDGRILVTERAGEIRVIRDGKLTEDKIEGVPEVYANGQGGLLDIQLHPDYSSNGWIYLSYAKPGPVGGGTTIARTHLTGNTLTDFEELFSAQPFVESGAHFGCRIVFDGKGYMYFSSGERGTKENSQDLSNHLGKIIRLHDDGKVPSDNPFVKQKNAKAEIWSYGHRNPQGLIYDADTETLWDVEHGPMGGDELNRVEKGKNYGWPVITFGKNYDGTPITDITQKEGMEQPVRYWVPSIGPCGAARIVGDKFPNWKNNILIGALAHTHVARVELDNGKYVTEEKLLDKIGRVRHVAESPDGDIYVATETPGMIVKLVPVD